MTLDGLIEQLEELRREVGGAALLYTIDPETAVVIPAINPYIDGGPVADALGGGTAAIVSLWDASDRFGDGLNDG